MKSWGFCVKNINNFGRPYSESKDAAAGASATALLVDQGALETLCPEHSTAAEPAPQRPKKNCATCRFGHRPNPVTARRMASSDRLPLALLRECVGHLRNTPEAPQLVSIWNEGCPGWERKR